MIFEKRFISSRRNRPFLRDNERYRIKELRAIVLHWTGNKGRGADADNNARYFDTSNVYASSQIIVDEDRIYQVMPLLEVAYHCGGRKYTEFGKELKKGFGSPNYVSIGVEVCVNNDADFEKTYKNTVVAFANILHTMKCYVGKITTHHRITGKNCPQFPNKEGIFKLIEGESFDKFVRDVEIEFWKTKDLIPFTIK